MALGLLISEIVRNEDIEVDRERVQERLNEIAATYPNPDDVRRAYLQNPEPMRQIESLVLEEQVMDWVLAQAKITEKPMSFTELTGFGKSN